MRSLLDGSRSRTISNAFLDSPKRSLRRPDTGQSRSRAVANLGTSPGWLSSCAQTMPRSSLGRPSSLTEERQRSCLWFPTSEKSLQTHLGKVISQACSQEIMLQDLIATLKAVGKPTELY